MRTDAEMGEATREMARRSYGYGRWDAPYWFIGPEQGQGREEKNDLKPRVEAWLHFGGKELCDCRAFHEFIREYRWHGEPTKLQSTWRSLILLLMTFLGKPTCGEDDEVRRAYQRDRWGRVSNGETCVIELSGLPANNFKVQIDREQFRQERIETIRQRICAYQPRLVVMYGKQDDLAWAQIAGHALKLGEPLTIESTTFLFTLHPNKHGLEKRYWIDLGDTLRSESSRS